jgi:hypothetical protein
MICHSFQSNMKSSLKEHHMTKLLALICLTFSPVLSFATSITINSPLDKFDLRQEIALNLNYTVNQLDESDAKIVVFRSNNNAWPKVQELPIAPSTQGTIMTDATPAFHFCEDDYAIRIMSGNRTLAGPVHFRAGVGACSSPDRSKFVNLENNMIDLLNFRPAHQRDRDTCGAFAATAALSAAYKRLKGHDVFLSQNYKHHIMKSIRLTRLPVFLYENESSFWGGNTVHDILKTLNHYPLPSEDYAPYQRQADLRRIVDQLGISNFNRNDDPRINRVTQHDVDLFEYEESHIPLQARQMAIYGVNSYRIHSVAEARDTNRIENYLKAGQEVIILLDLRWAAAAKRAKTMVYDASGTGRHIMVIVGFDKTDPANPYFLIKNSWADGILRVHYDVIRNQTFSDIGVIDSVRDHTLASASRCIGRWEMKYDGWRGELIIRRTLETKMNRLSGYLRIGEYLSDNKRYCVYGTWDQTTNKLMMRINFTESNEDKEYNVIYNYSLPPVRVMAKSVCPEVATGQYFELNMASHINRNATGFGVWNNGSFPVEIWRK